MCKFVIYYYYAKVVEDKMKTQAYNVLVLYIHNIYNLFCIYIYQKLYIKRENRKHIAKLRHSSFFFVIKILFILETSANFFLYFTLARSWRIYFVQGKIDKSWTHDADFFLNRIVKWCLNDRYTSIKFKWFRNPILLFICCYYYSKLVKRGCKY